MTTFSTVFKREIARIARKELKQEISALRSASGAHRSEIAALKRDIRGLQAAQKALQREAVPSKGSTAGTSADVRPVASQKRSGGFSAETLRAKREALGLTQARMAELLDASSLSVYKWEKGQVQPRQAQLERITAVLKMGKRKALKLLAS